MDIQLKKSDKGVANLLKNINHAVKSTQHFRSSLSSLINSGSMAAPSDRHNVASNHQEKRTSSSSLKKGGTRVASSSSSSSSQSDCSTRTFQSSSTTFTRTPDHDGYMWRKYGEKKIAKSMFPRSYYRCTYHTELDCKATKQVQQCSSTDHDDDDDDDSPMYKVTYFNEHTCNHSASPNTGTVYVDRQQILAFTVNDNYSSVNYSQDHQQQLAFSTGSNSSVMGSSVIDTHDQDLQSANLENYLISGFDLPYDMDELLLLSDYNMYD